MSLIKTFAVLIAIQAILLLVSCNFDSEILFGNPEVPIADIDKPTEEQTQIPTEEPTEKPTEPIITIDGITFDKSLKTKLKAAKNYAEVCEILGKEGTLVEQPEVIYYFNTKDQSPYFCVKFENAQDNALVCEDPRITMGELGLDFSKRNPDMLEQITIGRSFEEVCNICGIQGAFLLGESIVCEWTFDDINIRTEFKNTIKSNKNSWMISHIIFWDYETTKTIADVNREKVQLGQSYSELCELFGQTGFIGGDTLKWKFEDGSELILGYHYNYPASAEEDLTREKLAKYNGVSKVIISE